VCPPLSCCNRRVDGALPTQLYHLGRLLLACGTNELLPSQRSALETRLDLLWQQVQAAVQVRCQSSTAQALDVTERLLDKLLSSPCCQQTLRQAVPLAEALGPAARVV